ncbi:MAG TPA: hypothetical protein VKB09_07880, partial [Thermomicrobiales bacterium]|nr:hypothetical protein [Thermomicrobiales bacterium]
DLPHPVGIDRTVDDLELREHAVDAFDPLLFKVSKGGDEVGIVSIDIISEYVDLVPIDIGVDLDARHELDFRPGCGRFCLGESSHSLMVRQCEDAQSPPLGLPHQLGRRQQAVGDVAVCVEVNESH